MISTIDNHLLSVLLCWRDKYLDSVIEGYEVYWQNVLTTRLPNPILNLCKTTSGRKLDVFAFDKEVVHPLRDAMNESFPDLMGLVSRIKERAFHDRDDICFTLNLNVHHPKSGKEVKETKEATGHTKKQPFPDEKKKGKDNEKEKELQKEPEDKRDIDDEKEKQLKIEPEDKKKTTTNK